MELQANNINSLQNLPTQLKALAVSSEYHRLSSIAWLVQVVCALSGCICGVLFATFFQVPAFISAGVGGLVALAVFSLGLVRSYFVRRAASWMDNFDRSLFALELQGNLATLDTRLADLPSVIRRLVKSDDLSTFRDWYPDVSGVDVRHAALLCMRSSSDWDIKLRIRLTSALAGALLLWWILGATIALIFDWSVRQFVVDWSIPGLGFIILVVGMIERARAARDSRAVVLRKIDELIISEGICSHDGVGSRIVATEIEGLQRDICVARNVAGRVPNFLYRYFRETDEQRMRDLNGQLKDAWRAEL
jgi:hypothetical protein